MKLGGRRIELGEVDSALLGVPGVVGAAAAVRSSKAGNKLLVGYVAVDATFDPTAAAEHLRTDLPAALVPRLAVVESLPTRSSGKIDRDSLPWPLPAAGTAAGERQALEGTAATLGELWLDVLGAEVRGPRDDFFDLGGGSLTAAQMVSRLRVSHPEVTVADLYEHPTLGGLADLLDTMASPAAESDHLVRPTPSKTQVGQVVFTVPLRLLSGLRWLTWVLAVGNVLAALLDLGWLPTVSWWWVLLGYLTLVLAPGRMALSALGARWLLRGVGPGDYPRGGRTHLRLWLAERLVDELGATNLAGAALMPTYARWLGARVGRDVDLHSVPPVTGLLTLGNGCSVEPEVDLAGHWLDGDVLHIGTIQVGSGARVGTRSTLAPGAVVGKRAEVAPGSAVLGTVGVEEFWSGSPAESVTKARGPWSDDRPPRSRRWVAAYAATSVGIASLPFLAGLVGLLVLTPALAGSESLGDAAVGALRWLPPAVLAGGLTPHRPRAGVGPPAGTRAGGRPPPGAQPPGPPGVGNLARAGRGEDLAVPALRQRVDAGLAAPAGRRHRSRRRGLDRADDPQADLRQRPGVPGRRHADRVLRARRRLAARGAGEDRQARVRRQLRDGRSGAQGAQAGPGGGAVGCAAAQGGQGGRLVAGQPAGGAQARQRSGRRQPHLPAGPAAARWPEASSRPAGSCRCCSPPPWHSSWCWRSSASTTLSGSPRRRSCPAWC